MSDFASWRRTFLSMTLTTKKGIMIVLTSILFLSWQQMHLVPSVLSFSVLAPSSCTRTSATCNRIISSDRIGFHQIRFALINPKIHERCVRQSHMGLKATQMKDDNIVEAAELPDIQALYSKHCDDSGLMTKATLESLPPFAVLLAEGDLLPEEWEDIWDAAPKALGGLDGTARIGIDSFVQIYRDVDDLFEDGEESDDYSPVGNEEVNAAVDGNDDSGDDTDTEEKALLDAELEQIFQSICNDQNLISRDALKSWEEIQNLMSEGLLGDDEFDDLWKNAIKVRRSNDEFLDMNGFLGFNVALDGLFEISEEYEDDTELDTVVSSSETVDPTSTPTKSRTMIVEGDMPPAALFAQLADDNYLVGMDELKLWVELNDMLEEGDLLSNELQAMYDKALSTNSAGKLTEEGFLKLYKEIDALFDDEDDVEEDIPVLTEQRQDVTNTIKEDLLAFLDIVRDDADETMLPCGLDATEADRKQVINIVSVLEKQPTNLIKQKNGNIELSDLAGRWKLLYSSSSAMKFNKGLSGIGGSFPNGRCAGVTQNLKVTKFLNDVEYKERIEVKPSSASFDVTVTGSWDLRTSVSLFTGQPSIVLRVEPDRVSYGPTSTRADHWKSLGPLNMLDLSYLDEDLRVMRGCTSADTLFIFKKES